MHEVVIERPRGGWRVPRRASRWDWRTHDEEASPRRESTSRHRGGTKHLSDLLGPLRRFLDGAVGRPWDDVYSELRAGISPRSQLHLHILEHVRWMVAERGPFLVEEGVLRRQARWDTVLDHGDAISPRRFLLRRVGRPWAEVRAEWGPGWRPSLVELDAVRFEGRLYAWLPATKTLPERRGSLLPRGRLYVERGILRLVR